MPKSWLKEDKLCSRSAGSLALSYKQDYFTRFFYNVVLLAGVANKFSDRVIITINSLLVLENESNVSVYRVIVAVSLQTLRCRIQRTVSSGY